jgi:hypothetical protein
MLHLLFQSDICIVSWVTKYNLYNQVKSTVRVPVTECVIHLHRRHLFYLERRSTFSYCQRQDAAVRASIIHWKSPNIKTSLLAFVAIGQILVNETDGSRVGHQYQGVLAPLREIVVVSSVKRKLPMLLFHTQLHIEILNNGTRTR